ncbi:unnamed protein product [Brugia timori]|uniref:phenylalanine--tRNA ligase n=1 Tax=Brugia timori TaxID=42155 RepID=A0A3P7X7X3_9BILA|nr:unnamed protein product [Brugia timori]
MNHLKILKTFLSDIPESSSLNAICETRMSPSGIEETGDASLPQNLLYHLEKHQHFETFEYATAAKEDHQKVVGAVKSLEAVEGVCVLLVETEERISKTFELTDEGNEMVENAKIFLFVGPSGIDQAELMKLPYGKVGISKAIASGWVAIDKTGGTVRLVRKVDTINDKVQSQLKLILEGNVQKLDVKTLNELKKRKLVTEMLVF